MRYPLPLLAGLCLACGVPEPPAPEQGGPPLPPHRVFPTAAAALQAVQELHPRVLGVGEYHLTRDGPQVPSALSRFTAELLPVLAPSTTDLVLETWVVDGVCGEQEQQVAEQVPQDTLRPPETESELARLARRARELGVAPHALTLSCADYASLLATEQGGDAGVQYDTLLRLLTDKMRALALEGLALPDARVVIYSGAVHNDLSPPAELAAWSYGPRVEAVGGDAYVELDLYVPEVVVRQASLSGEPWFPLLDGAVGPDRVLLVERAPRSFILLLPTTPGSAEAAVD